MRMKLLKRFGVEILAFALTFICVAALFAQDAPPLPVPTDQGQALVIALFAAALPFIVAALRKLKPTMPRILVWGLAPLLGTAIAWLTHLGGLNGWKGLAAGLIAVAFHEARTTLSEHGVNG